MYLCKRIAVYMTICISANKEIREYVYIKNINQPI